MKKVMYCQSCGFPLAKPEDHGTNEDGSWNEDYCVYCYKDGAFTVDMTMEEMIEFCADHAEEWNMQTTKKEAVEMMQKLFPTLKRWQQA